MPANFAPLFRRMGPFFGSFSIHLMLLLVGIFLSSSPVLRNPFGSASSAESLASSLRFIALEPVVRLATARSKPVSQPVTDGLTVLPKKANENTAVSEDSNPVVPTSGGTALLGTEDGARTATETERYAFGLRQLIDRKKSYPSLSRKMGETGQVLIRARVARDGTLSDVAIQSKSKFPRLDQAALEIVSAIGKYEPIPESIPNAPLLIAIPIEYSL